MKKILIVCTILLIAALLLCGKFYADFPLMWLAGTTPSLTVMRVGLLVILGVLLFTETPRALYFRYAIAVIALALGVTTGVLMLHDGIEVLDAIVFMEVAVIFGIEALETPRSYAMVLLPKRTDVLAK